MLALRLRIDAQPRAKNGQPAQSTTGKASSIWIHADVRGLTRADTPPPVSMSPMARPNTGSVSAALVQKRRVMSTSSGFGPSSISIVRGSSAMPQIGQAPGAARTISGCIGQVYSTRVIGPAGNSGSSAMPHDGHGTGVASRTSGHMGHTYAAGAGRRALGAGCTCPAAGRWAPDSAPSALRRGSPEPWRRRPGRCNIIGAPWPCPMPCGFQSGARYFAGSAANFVRQPAQQK